MSENTLASSISLNGLWKLEGGDKSGTVNVPGVWEVQGWSLDIDSAVCRREFTLPATWAGARLLLQFGAVSYFVEVRINGEVVGTHEGLWDPFTLDITDAALPGATNQIELHITKPSNDKNGSYPYRQVLVGFIPYVSTTFGGSWQTISLEAHTVPVWTEVQVAPDWETGTVKVRASLDGPVSNCTAEILDDAGQVQAQSTIQTGQAELWVNNPLTWTPQVPVLYKLRLRAEDGNIIITETTRCFGFRRLHVAGGTLLFNGEAFSLRGVLSWGWNPRTLAPNPTDDEIRDEFQRVRELGFNLVKLCLFVPPPRVFEIADEEGMLLWLELPMWLPTLTDHLRQQARLEYAAILAKVHHHPSVVIYSLGCELGSDMADAALLAALDRLTREATCGVLVCDNSGSGEAYQGLDFDFADFNDYHFYADLHQFRPLLDHFRRDWRSERPLIFGEFCYSDDYRDPIELTTNDGVRAWWRDLTGVEGTLERWAYSRQEERMAALNLPFTDAELMARSRQQSLVTRKATLEMVRSRRGMGGYVITGLRDTPISTAGVFDDLNRTKFDVQRFRQFNADSVLVLEQGRARIWHNGDRPDPQDRFCHTSGQPVSLRMVLSHTGPAIEQANLTWELIPVGASPTHADHLQGRATIAAIPGSPCEVSRIEFVAPAIAEPQQWTLAAEIEGVTTNIWNLWFYPQVPAWPENLYIYDPAGSLAGYEGIQHITVPQTGMLLISSVFTADVAAFVENGGRVIVIQAGMGSLPAVASDFWGESITLLYNHPLLERFPHQGYADMQFYHIAGDHVLSELPGVDMVQSVIGRLNARVFDLAYYLVAFQLGQGRGFATTLRLAGGQGDQAVRLSTNIAGKWLLWQMVDQLASNKS